MFDNIVMPTLTTLTPGSVVDVVIIGIGMLAIYGIQNKLAFNRRVRQKLPNDLDTWRVPGTVHTDEDAVWSPLITVLRKQGLVLWPNYKDSGCVVRSPDDKYPLSSGFAYATATRGIADGVGTVCILKRFMHKNALTRVVRTRDGHDASIRVIVIRDEGYEHLNILRKIASGPSSLLSCNHALPILAEFQFEDVIFGLFPIVGGSLEYAFGSWPQNSVGDILDMLMQALEALVFIHAANIAHRDAFHDNFLVQWHPESMLKATPPVSRPRVYIIDFEVAVEFPPESSPIQRLSSGYPLGGSFTQAETYGRDIAPEMATLDRPYCPFKLDISQLGKSFEEFSATIDEIDRVISDMRCHPPEARITAAATLERLQSAVLAVPPASLLISPKVTIIKD